MPDNKKSKELDRLLNSLGDDQVIFRMEYDNPQGRYFRNAIVRDSATIGEVVDVGFVHAESPDDKFVCGSIIMPVGYRRGESGM